MGVFVVAALAAGGLVAWRVAAAPATAAKPRSQFMPYVDVTATPRLAFEDSPILPNSNLVLSFVVSSLTDACQPSWGTAYSLQAADYQLDLDRRIARVRSKNGQVSVSFGGAANQELSIGCTDPTKLADAYSSVINRYSLDAVDFDIEGQAASAPAVSARRASAIAVVQKQMASQGKQLAVWLTLPVDPNGLTPAGVAILNATIAAGVRLSGVNAMTMDYGASKPSTDTMVKASEDALTAVHTQLLASYSAAGLPLSDLAGWQHIGATPMIGQNDTADELLQVKDVSELVAFAEEHRMARLSMWSLNRDQSCGPNYANVEIVSDACSGVAQQIGAYATAMSVFTTAEAPALSGAPTSSSSQTGSQLSQLSQPDNPATSPYPIWNSEVAYPANTKIVWHHNVYVSKWWTQSDVPDAPVASTSQTPWTLIGPVLPGEHPQPTPTLPAGTYPEWDANKVYKAGDSVLYLGSGYRAKWWNQGAVPGLIVYGQQTQPWQLVTSASSSPSAAASPAA